MMHDDAEWIERSALEDVYRAAPPEVARQLGLQPFSHGGAFVGLAASLPASAIVVNRTIGLGVTMPATRDQVEEIVGAHAAAGVTRYFVHRHPQSAPPELDAWLQGAGLVPARGWQKFERPLDPVEPVRSGLEIRHVGREHGEDFARIACAAFDMGEEAVPWLAELPGRSGWHVFMSFEDGEPAGTGALHVGDGLAWFDFGATAPDFRRRGSQAALLARRIEHALELGCRRLLTCTGKAVPGDPQHSYRNLLKAGFRETTTRANFAPPRPG
jgi:GNAT superfamily N-acetyltransferase